MLKDFHTKKGITTKSQSCCKYAATVAYIIHCRHQHASPAEGIQKLTAKMQLSRSAWWTSRTGRPEPLAGLAKCNAICITYHKRHKHLILPSCIIPPGPIGLILGSAEGKVVMDMKSHHFKCPRTNAFQEASWQGSCPLALA